ncbi:MAG: hypothetical protein ABS939_02465 [Psychrobacillus sp.]
MAVNYDNLDPYGSYGDNSELSPYELLMQMKSWDSAIRLWTSSELDLRVEKDGVISAINLSPEQIVIDTARLDITAVVTFNALKEDGGTTFIHGGNIITETILAEAIATEAITADKINVGSLFGLEITGLILKGSTIISDNGVNSVVMDGGMIEFGGQTGAGVANITIQDNKIEWDRYIPEVSTEIFGSMGVLTLHSSHGMTISSSQGSIDFEGRVDFSGASVSGLTANSATYATYLSWGGQYYSAARLLKTETDGLEITRSTSTSDSKTMVVKVNGVYVGSFNVS